MDQLDLRRIAPDGVIRTDDLRAAGVTSHALATRCRPSGPWRRVLPGVLLMGTGPPTRSQWLRAAMAYASQGAVITGTDALCAHGIPVPRGASVLILLPAGRRLVGRANLTVERTTRLPEPHWHGGLPYAPVVRATVDAARHEHDRNRLVALLGAPLRAGACTVAELQAELSAGSRRGSAGPRSVLRAYQYSSGSLPSMSRTWRRAQDGQSQTRPRSAFSATQASASTGDASARNLPHLEHCASGG
jgi:hypothetical protein